MRPINVITLVYKSTNCYLIPYKDGWLMIDAGRPDTFSQLLQLLSQNNISIHEVNYLVVTHFHPDHAGLTQILKDLGTTLILHEYQIPYISKLNLLFKKKSKANYRDITTAGSIMVKDSDSRSFLESIGIQGELIFTPGHSDDSVSLIIDDCCAFVGDLPAPGLAEAYEESDRIILEDSWNRIREHNIKTVYPGHGDAYPL